MGWPRLGRASSDVIRFKKGKAHIAKGAAKSPTMILAFGSVCYSFGKLQLPLMFAKWICLDLKHEVFRAGAETETLFHKAETPFFLSRIKKNLQSMIHDNDSWFMIMIHDGNILQNCQN